MLADHVAKGRDCTVACIEVPQPGQCLRRDGGGRGAHHPPSSWKPADPPACRAEAGPLPGQHGRLRVQRALPVGELERDINDPRLHHDFSRTSFPRRGARRRSGGRRPFDLSAVGTGSARPYWRDVGTIDAYWDANIDLTATDPLLNLDDTRWPIWTYQRSCRRRSSCTTRTTAAAWRSDPPWSRRLHRLRLRCSLGAVLQRAGAFLRQRQLGRAAAACGWGAARG